MDNLKEALCIFLPAWTAPNAKQGIIDNVRAYYLDNQVYEIQMRALTMCKNIEISRMLGCNEIIIPVIIHEYCELVMCCRAITALLPPLKNNLNVLMIQGHIDIKNLGSLLVQDLNYFANEKGVQFDLTQAMALFKQHSNGDVAKILKENKFLSKGFVSSHLFENQLA